LRRLQEVMAKNEKKVEVEGNYRGKEGTFEWIIESDGFVNHRLFRPKR
jgi:hypothetical protein